MNQRRRLGVRVIVIGLILTFASAACAPLNEPATSGLIAQTADVATVTAPPETPDVGATILADKATLAATLTPLPPLTPEIGPTGIYDDVYVKAHWAKRGFTVQNAWFGLQDGNAVTVYAGAFEADPQQGALQLVMILPYRSLEEAFLTEIKHGALSVQAEQNNRLTILAADGTTLYFDVPARMFVASLNELAPTATPPPTYTPYAPPPTVPPVTGYPNMQPTMQSTAIP